MKRSYPVLMFAFIFTMAAVSLPVNGEEVAIHGFISQGFLKTDQNNYLADTDEGSFQFNEMGINFTTFVASDLKVGCQFFARDLGDVGNDEIVVNWAFAEYTFRNWLGLRTGIIKKPFGFYNDIRDFDSLRAPIFLPSSVYNEWLRDGLDKLKGIEFFGAIEMGGLGLLEYQLQTGINPVALDSGSAKYITEIVAGGLDTMSLMESDTSYIARLVWTTPLDGLRFGATYHNTGFYYEGDKDLSPALLDVSITVDGGSDLYIFSGEYAYGNLKIAAENYWTIGDTTSTIFIPGMAPIIKKGDIDNKKPYYISLGYRFTEWFEASFYYSDYNGGDNDAGDVNELTDQCLSLRFDINPSWTAKLEAHVMDGEYGVSADDDGHTYSEWMLYAAKLSYSF